MNQVSSYTPKFAIVGLGFIAPRHLEAIRSVGGSVSYLCDVNKDKITKFVKQYFVAAPPTTTNFRKIKDVDFVVICTPNNLHFPMARYFTNKGMKVIVEKPPVLDSKQIEVLKDKQVFTVLQLHYHPAIIEVRKDAKEIYTVDMTIKVKRDSRYWKSWKGDKKRSGGIMFNLGVHYIDLLLHLFGETAQVIEHKTGKNRAIGVLKVGNAMVCYTIEIMDTDVGQTRSLLFNEKYKLELSDKDNLSFENLHTMVYEEILSGRGILLKDCLPTIKLIEQLQ